MPTKPTAVPSIVSRPRNHFDTYLNVIGGMVVLMCVFIVGFYAGKLWGGESIDEDIPLYSILNADIEQDETELDFELFWEVWRTLESSYVEEDISEYDLYYGALKGLVAGVGDPVTIFLTPDETDQYNEGNEGKFEGIGAELGYENGGVIIVAPLEGSPAQDAGLRAGDRIIKVDGDDILSENIFQVVARIRGDAGTDVVITVEREGKSDMLDITVTRGEITVPSVSYDGTENGIAVIDVDRFTEASLSAWEERWDEVVTEVVSDGADTVILDLRGNPGGYFNAAIWAAGEFLPNETLVSQQYDRNQNTIDFKVMREGRLQSVDLIVLVDGASASASEILAGALQYYDRAYVIGEETYGKGTAQQVIDYVDGSSLHITTLKWLLPGGESLDEDHVIVPDSIVELTEDDFTNGNDPQLEAAYEYLN